jgi:hypothetical protein
MNLDVHTGIKKLPETMDARFRASPRYSGARKFFDRPPIRSGCALLGVAIIIVPDGEE